MSNKKIGMRNNLGERLRFYRKRKGWTGSDLSKLIGISQGSLSDIETNKTTPSSKTLESLIRNTDIDIVWLLTGAEPTRHDVAYKSRELTILDEFEEWISEEIRREPEKEIWFKIQIQESFPGFKTWKEEKEGKTEITPGDLAKKVA